MNRLQRRLAIAGIALAALCTVVFMLTRATEEPAPKPALRSFESFRTEFRKADGTLPDNSELLNHLIAKGIPFAADAICDATRQDCAQVKRPSALAPQVHFAPGVLNSHDEKIVTQKFSAIWTNYEKTLFASYPQIALNRAEVTAAKKMRLNFSSEFLSLAADENSLTEFSEALAELNQAGLRGSEIFVEGKRLSEHLSEMDARRDKEALQAQPATGHTR